MARSNARLARGVFSAVLAAVLSLPVASPGLAATLELRVATAYAADNFQTRNLQAFADDVEKATQGKVGFRLFPAGALIKPAEIFDGVRNGRAEGGEVIMSSLSRDVRLFGIDALPFIVSGYEDARRMWAASRPAVEKAMAERGLQLLYAVPWPPQNLYARRPIAVVQDFKGLRMRSYSPATERIAEFIGAKPVTIQVVDLAGAIAASELDVMLTSSWTGVESRAWSGLPYYYRVNAWIPKNMVFVRKDIHDKLDADARTKLAEAARAAEERGWKMSQDSDRQYEAALQANGMQVATIDPFLRRYLDRIGEKLAREWLARATGDELAVLLRYTTERSMKN